MTTSFLHQKKFQPHVPHVLRCFIQISLHELGGIRVRWGPLAHSFSWGDQVLPDHICTAARVWFLGNFCLFFLCSFFTWLKQNSPLRIKDSVLPTELFLQSKYLLTRLGFLETFQLRNENSHNNFLTSINFDFLGRCSIQLPSAQPSGTNSSPAPGEPKRCWTRTHLAFCHWASQSSCYN